MSTIARPPERLVVNDQLVLRRESVDDAEVVAVAVAESLAHLARWMPWATPEATAPLRQRERLSAMSKAWEEGSSFTYLLLPADESSVLRGIGLHHRTEPNILAIGYWVHPRHVGNGYATAATGVVARAALALPGIDLVEIRCDVANEKSQAIPRRLGFRLDRVEPEEIVAPAETGQSMVWVFSL